MFNGTLHVPDYTRMFFHYHRSTVSMHFRPSPILLFLAGAYGCISSLVDDTISLPRILWGVQSDAQFSQFIPSEFDHRLKERYPAAGRKLRRRWRSAGRRLCADHGLGRNEMAQWLVGRGDI